MPRWLPVVIVIAVIAIVVLMLYRWTKKQQKKNDEAQEMMDQNQQNVSMLIIDKKKMKLKETDLPEAAAKSIPFLFRGTKFPIVKAKVGPRIMTFIPDGPVYDVIPVKKEVKATISGLYIISVKGIRGPLAAPEKKKEGKLAILFKKGRGEL